MEKDFWEWYNEKNKQEGGLVSKTNAARMIGTTKQYVDRLVKNKKLKSHTYDGLEFIGFNEISKEIIRRERRQERIKDKLKYTIQTNAEYNSQKEMEEIEKHSKKPAHITKEEWENWKALDKKIRYNGKYPEEEAMESIKKIMNIPPKHPSQKNKDEN